MAKTVTINGGVAHLSVSDKHLSPLCGATRERPYEGRKAGIGDVTCTRCVPSSSQRWPSSKPLRRPHRATSHSSGRFAHANSRLRIGGTAEPPPCNQPSGAMLTPSARRNASWQISAGGLARLRSPAAGSETVMFKRFAQLALLKRGYDWWQARRRSR